jgi:hypothetical protein
MNPGAGWAFVQQTNKILFRVMNAGARRMPSWQAVDAHAL